MTTMTEDDLSSLVELPGEEMKQLADDDLERFGWYELRDTLYLPSEGVYVQFKRIQFRILVMEKPQYE